MRQAARDELPEDFYIPMALDAPNLTALSPFLVPQTHLGSPGVFRGMSVFMFVLIALGVPINSLTIFCTAKYKKLRSHLNYILVNLAVSNLLVICVGSTTAFYSFSQMYFALGPTACKIEGFAATLGGMVSLWSLAVVAFERFLVICKPLGNFTFRGSHAVLGCAATWVLGLVASAPPLFGWSRYIPEGLQCSCGPDWYTTGNKWNNESYVLFLFCFCFGVPLAIIIFSYGRLLITLRAVARQQEQSASTQKAEREVTKMVVVMVLGFLLCWAPYTAFALWVVTHRGRSFEVGLASVPSVFSKSSTVYNPVIYVLWVPVSLWVPVPLWVTVPLWVDAVGHSVAMGLGALWVAVLWVTVSLWVMVPLWVAVLWVPVSLWVTVPLWVAVLWVWVPWVPAPRPVAVPLVHAEAGVLREEPLRGRGRRLGLLAGHPGLLRLLQPGLARVACPIAGPAP